MNDVLDFHAMTNGEFQLTPAPVAITQAMLVALRRCRLYMSNDIRFQYHLPHMCSVVSVDMLRVTQLLSNAISNAGKFVCPGGIVDVDVQIVPAAAPRLPGATSQASAAPGATPISVSPPSDNADVYVVITVSNSRYRANRVKDCDALFIPFKRKRQASIAAAPTSQGTHACPSVCCMDCVCSL